MTGAPVSFTLDMPGADYPQDIDLPVHGDGERADLHEALWVYGYDQASRIGYYAYLVHDDSNHARRRETVALFLPDGTRLVHTGEGGKSTAGCAAGDCLSLTCIEPFQRWHAEFAGTMAKLPANPAAAPRAVEPSVAAKLSLDVADPATPAWNVERGWGDALPAFRLHQLHRARGVLSAAGRTHALNSICFRSHSLRTRDLPGYTGHAFANALFPSGRAFGLLRYRATDRLPERGRGFVFIDGAMHEAEVRAWPYLVSDQSAGEAVLVKLDGAFGTEVIEGVTIGSVFSTSGADGRGWGVHGGKKDGYVLSSAFAKYSWRGESAIGQLDRSALRNHFATQISG